LHAFGWLSISVSGFLVLVREKDHSAEINERYLKSRDEDTGPAGPVRYFRSLKIYWAYRAMRDLLLLPRTGHELTLDMSTLIIVLLTFKIGYIVHDSATPLKLIENGLPKEINAIMALVYLPIHILVSIYAVKWSTGRRPLLIVSFFVYFQWLISIWCRYSISLFAVMFVISFPKYESTPVYMVCYVLLSLVSSILSNAMMASQVRTLGMTLRERIFQ